RWMNGERDDVLKAMGDWVSAHPQDVRMRSVLAARLIEVGDESAAAGHYQVLIDGGLEDPVALNNMAWLLREEQTDLALEYIQRADKLAPDSASIKDTYAMVELERGSFDRALSLNQRAIDAAPDSEELTLNRARILARAGRSTEARQLLEKISGSSNAQLGKEASLLLQSMTR
ncbi:MAG: tetratricopeptide repeat protein, partial [Congregibacter sp.]|nr:tetratricopeptide repeat protein [Congregibacter sp.]